MKVIYLSKEKPKLKWQWGQEDIFIVGMKGSRKSTKCKSILALIRDKVPCWVHSPQRPVENYGSFCNVVQNINQMVYGHYVYAGRYSEESHIKFCQRAFNNFGNMVLVHDDLHESVTKHSVQKELSTLVQSGRNRNISNIFIATNPAVVPNWILGNVSVAFAFRVQLEAHCRWLAENYFGAEAWLLIQKDRRIKYFKSDTDPDVLPKGSYIMRNSDEPETTVVINDLEEKVISSNNVEDL